jgi:hypothetical protein
MLDYNRAARRWVEPLLGLAVGGSVALRFLAPLADPAGELGIIPGGAGTYLDYLAANSYVRELRTEEIAALGGQLRQGAREVLLSGAFAESVAAAQGLNTAREMFEAASGVLIGGQVCRIHTLKPLDAGEEVYAWQLLCDAPLEAA